jgi:hypothetical protein
MLIAISTLEHACMPNDRIQKSVRLMTSNTLEHVLVPVVNRIAQNLARFAKCDAFGVQAKVLVADMNVLHNLQTRV